MAFRSAQQRFLSFSKDPRHFQIVTLSSLFLLYFFVFGLFTDYLVAILTWGACLITQFGFSKYYNVKYDPRSAMITGLSLSILLKGTFLFVVPLAGALAIGSKFLIRQKQAHIFNPANFGIVMMLLLLPDFTWVSPAQWGSAVWLVTFLVCFAILVLSRASSAIVSISFIMFWAGLIFGRAFWLGDPMAIPVLSMQSGALLIFTFFMISDPKTVPVSSSGQIVFALAIAVTAFILQFVFQSREALFYALVAICLARTILSYTVLPRKPLNMGEVL